MTSDNYDQFLLLMSIAEIITTLDGWVWGTVMMVLIIAVGILLSVRTGFSS